MRIVLDSTTFIADLRLQGTMFRVLRDAVAKAGYTLHVPAVVVEEVKNKYRERLTKAVDELASKYEDLERLGVPDKPPDFGGAWFDAQCALYDDHLKRWLRDRQAELLPVPDIAHESLIHRALSRRRPFSDKGTGYRDALIWESVLRLAAAQDDEILFVSGNTHDFAMAEGGLHEDLKGDLLERGLSEERVRLVVGLDALVNAFIKPDLQRLDEIREALRGSAYEPLDIAAALTEIIPSLVSGRELRGRDLGLPDDVEEGTVISAYDVEEIDVTDVLQLPDGELFIQVDATVTCEVEYSTHVVERVRLGSNYGIDEYDTFKRRVKETSEKELQVALQMTFDPTTREITSTDVDYIQPR